MKDETLSKVNALLAELAKEAGPDGTVRRPPAAVAQSVGLRSGLETARAMRALLARKRVEGGGEDGYRVINTDPIKPGEPLAIVPQRKPRGKASAVRAEAHDPMPGVPTYADIGRAIVDRLVTLSNEVAGLRAGAGTEERSRMESAERRAQAAEVRMKELQIKLEMAESNLREVLRAASLAKGGTSGMIDDPEAAAVLRFLQSSEEAAEPVVE